MAAAPRPDWPLQILYLSPVTPGAGGTGIEQRAWCHLEALRRMGDVRLILTVTVGQIERGLELDGVRSLCKSISIVALRPSWKLARRRVPGLTFLVRLLFLRSAAYRAAVSDLERVRAELRGERPDLVFCFRVRSFVAWEQLRDGASKQAPLFVDFDDVESIAIRREIPYERARIGVEQSWVARLEAVEASLTESRVLRSADIVGVCSHVDRRRLESSNCRAAIAVVPNSCALREALPVRPVGDIARLLFVGTMSYAPNADAIIYFCEQIFPLVRERCRRPVELTVIGRNPGADVLALAKHAGVTIAGGVESVLPYYDEADVVIAPIRSGGGTRIKVLEAMVFGRAVVSTTLGAEGLEVTAGRDLLVADLPQDFASACVELIEDEPERNRIASSGRARVLSTYDRSRVQQALIAAVRDHAPSAKREDNRTEQTFRV